MLLRFATEIQWKHADQGGEVLACVRGNSTNSIYNAQSAALVMMFAFFTFSQPTSHHVSFI